MSVLSSGRATRARLFSRAGVLERTARNQVPLDVVWLRVVRQNPHRLDQRADRGGLGRWKQQVEVLMPHMRTFASRKPRVFAATAQAL
jgi:hypothetical protein